MPSLLFYTVSFDSVDCKYISGTEFYNGFHRWNNPNLIFHQVMLGNTCIFTLLTLCKSTRGMFSPCVLSLPHSSRFILIVSLPSPDWVDLSPLCMFNFFLIFYFSDRYVCDEGIGVIASGLRASWKQTLWLSRAPSTSPRSRLFMKYLLSWIAWSLPRWL